VRGSIQDLHVNMTTNLLFRISDGTLDRQSVAIAAALGSEAAIATGVNPVVLHDHYRKRIEQIAACLTQRQCIMFGYECAVRALRVWENLFPLDLRPRHAVEAVRPWLSENESPADFQALCHAAEQAHIDVDYPELTEDVDRSRCAAREAASACSHAALAVKNAIDHEEHREMCHMTGWIARFGVKSAPDPQFEIEWQIGRLVEMLLQ
jgi:hypothetical protein